MPPQRHANAYLATQVQSSTPLERVVLLYDGAIRAILAARDAVARGDIPARREAVGRAMAIVGELKSSLDLGRGGEIATSLDGLYAYVNERLMECTMTQSAQPLEHARRVMSTLRDAWRTIAMRTAAGSAA